jgi:hypothetical protein
MTTIPNLNIVIQQGDAVRDSQNIRNQVLESAQNTVFERIAEDNRKRTIVAQTEEADKIVLTNEQRSVGNLKRLRKQERKKKARAAMEKTIDPDAPGRLLNTIV